MVLRGNHLQRCSLAIAPFVVINVSLSGTCDALVLIGGSGAVATSPLDASGHVGLFAPAARFDGAESDWAMDTSPSGRVYVLGGKVDELTASTAVRSTRRL